MRRLFLLALLICLNICSGFSKIKSSLIWDVESAQASIKGSNMDITIQFRLIDDGVAKNSAVVLQPYVKYGKQTLELVPLSVYRLDNFGRTPTVRSDCRQASGKTLEKRIVSGTTGFHPITVVSTIPYDPSVQEFQVIVGMTEYTAKDKRSYGEERVVADFKRNPCPEFKPSIFSLKPVFDQKSVRTAIIPLHLTFKDGNDAVIRDNEPDNASALHKFISSTTLLLNEPRTKVNSVALTCYTGIEGPEQSNLAVSKKRNANLMAYLKKKGTFGKRTVSQSSFGEDWTALGRWISDSFWGKDANVRGIVYGTNSKDVKESRLKSDYPELWNAMQSYCFQDLSRYECVLMYTVQPFHTKDELWSAYKTDPRLLSPEDFYNLSARYHYLSEQWCDVFLEASSYWPNNMECNINAVAGLLALGNTRKAGELLRTCGNSDYAKYFESTWLAMMGQYEEAYNKLTGLKLYEHTTELETTRARLKEILDWGSTFTPWSVTLHKFEF